MSDTKPTTFQELMASVGYILLYWGMLEVALRTKTETSPQKTGPSTKERGPHPSVVADLKAWIDLQRESPSLTAAQSELLTKIETDMTAARGIRNLIAHGIVGASANPSSPDEPYLDCQHTGGGCRRLAYSELRETVQTVDRCRRQIDLFPRPIPCGEAVHQGARATIAHAP